MSATSAVLSLVDATSMDVRFPWTRRDQSVLVQAARTSGSDALRRELFGRFQELLELSAEWDGKWVAPKVKTVAAALSLGSIIIEKSIPKPHALNITASRDGLVLFTLFGKDGREAELWLGEAPWGAFEYVLSRGDEAHSGVAPLHEFARVAGWLSGHGDLVGLSA